MAELPTLFLAAHCTSIGEIRELNLTEEDELIFQPGFLPLSVLCQVIVGRPVAEQTELQFIDGPPDPVVDEGFQLFRIADEVVQRLTTSTLPQDRNTVASWLEGLNSLGQTNHDSAAFATALAELTRLAQRGQSTGKCLFVSVLYR